MVAMMNLIKISENKKQNFREYVASDHFAIMVKK